MGHSKGGDMNARYDLIEDSDLLAEVFPATSDQTSDLGTKMKK